MLGTRVSHLSAENTVNQNFCNFSLLISVNPCSPNFTYLAGTQVYRFNLVQTFSNTPQCFPQHQIFIKSMALQARA